MELTDTIILGKNGPGSNGSAEVLHTSQISINKASPLDAVYSHTKDTESWLDLLVNYIYIYICLL